MNLPLELWTHDLHICFCFFCSLEDGEKKDLDKNKDESPPDTPAEGEKRPPKNRPRKKENPPEAFMASFFAGLEIYQTKMLVCIHSVSMEFVSLCNI